VILVAPATREAAVVRQKWLTAATIGWNVVEGVVAISAGVVAASASLNVASRVASPHLLRLRAAAFHEPLKPVP